MISVTSPSSGGHSSQVSTPEVDSIESEGCLSTTKVQMRHALPYVIPTAIIKKHSKLDGRSLISGFDVDGWPSAFSPSDEFRSLCNTALSSPRPHPDQKRGKSGYLLTFAVSLKPWSVVQNAMGCIRFSHMNSVRLMICFFCVCVFLPDL